MIINVTIENWMSFRDEAKFSMVASRERRHRARLPHVSKFQMRILPIAVTYGGNASGKTNFFKALSFMKSFIVKGSAPDSLIPIDPFQLDDSNSERSCSFSIELLIEEEIYEFSFTVTRKEVIREKLIKVLSTKDKVLYSREGGRVTFADKLKSDDFLHFAFKGTRDNQLFLTNSVSQKVEEFKPVYDWFRDTLELIAPDSRFSPFEEFLNEGQPLYATMNSILPHLDTGISRITMEEFPIEHLHLPDSFKVRLEERLKEGDAVALLTAPRNENCIITRRADQLVAKKLMTLHTKADGTETTFELHQESDGSRRLINLLPAFLDLISQSKKVYVIDELDRCLHTLLSQQLLEAFLSSCSPDTRSQLLFSTHDALLMDQEIFRRDEMWVTERESNGATTLTSFSEYKDVRSDKDIRKSYLQGRLGGIPHLTLENALATQL